MTTLRICFTLPPRARFSENPRLVKGLIDGVAGACAAFWKDWQLPPLYRSGIVYRKEPLHGSGFEDFALPWQTYLRRWGDCDDLVIYRVAELLAHGEKAHCIADWNRGELHVRVRRANGQEEDPSIELGALNQ